MMRFWFLLLCLCSSISVFSETRIYFGGYAQIAQLDISELKYPSIAINLDDFNDEASN